MTIKPLRYVHAGMRGTGCGTEWFDSLPWVEDDDWQPWALRRRPAEGMQPECWTSDPITITECFAPDYNGPYQFDRDAVESRRRGERYRADVPPSLMQLAARSAERMAREAMTDQRIRQREYQRAVIRARERMQQSRQERIAAMVLSARYAQLCEQRRAETAAEFIKRRIRAAA